MHNKKNISAYLIFTIILVFSACSTDADLEELKNEIIKTEHSFWKMGKSDGIKNAFLHFADDDAVLLRHDKLIRGKQEIKEYFENQTLTNINLDWAAHFVDVAKSGDLAYTYGSYDFSALNAEGDSISSEGVFHTVWKRQSDGSWKYVWD